jgi:phosphate:Na+ symporter
MEAKAADRNVRSLQGAATGADAVLAAGVDSGIFLRIVRDLRRVHSHIAALAYPVVERAAEGVDRRAQTVPLSTTGGVGQARSAAEFGDRH